MSETRLIYAALAKCIAAVGVVGKTRKNAAQGYQFRGIDDVLSACQSVLAENGVVCVPQVRERERELMQTKSGGSMVSVRFLVDHHFYAADGSFVTATTLGEAMDSGDKASNKAMSAALKYALVETLCIPTFEDGRDTEEHSPELAAQPKPPPATRPPVKSSRPPIADVPSLSAPPDPVTLAAMSLATAIATARSTAELTALTMRLRALPEAERATLRPAYDARLKEVAS